LKNRNGKLIGEVAEIDFYRKQDFQLLQSIVKTDFLQSSYQNIKSSLPEDLFKTLTKESRENGHFIFDEKLYIYNENGITNYHPTLEHAGVMFCLIYEDQAKTFEIKDGNN